MMWSEGGEPMSKHDVRSVILASYLKWLFYSKGYYSVYQRYNYL